MIRLGVTGVDNSHIDAVVGFLADRAASEVRLTAALAGPPPRRCLSTLPEAEKIWRATTADMIDDVDAVLICDRDGTDHAAPAGAFLRAGKSVYVDKPFTVDPDEARALVAVARAGGVLLTSYSPLRFEADVQELALLVADLGPPRRLTMAGPVYPDSPYGLSYYSSHHCDLAITLTQGRIHRIRGSAGTDGIRLAGRIGTSALALRLITRDQSSADFTITAEWDDRQEHRVVRTGDDFFFAGLGRFLAAAAGDAPSPVSGDRMVAAVELAERVGTAFAAITARRTTTPTKGTGQ